MNICMHQTAFTIPPRHPQHRPFGPRAWRLCSPKMCHRHRRIGSCVGQAGMVARIKCSQSANASRHASWGGQQRKCYRCEHECEMKTKRERTRERGSCAPDKQEAAVCLCVCICVCVVRLCACTQRSRRLVHMRCTQTQMHECPGARTYSAKMDGVFGYVLHFCLLLSISFSLSLSLVLYICSAGYASLGARAGSGNKRLLLFYTRWGIYIYIHIARARGNLLLLHHLSTASFIQPPLQQNRRTAT